MLEAEQSFKYKRKCDCKKLKDLLFEVSFLHM